MSEVARLLLTPAEVEDLTGTPQRRRQMGWLREHGFACELGADGRVKVLRAAVEARMMPGQARHRAKTEPNLAALRKAS